MNVTLIEKGVFVDVIKLRMSKRGQWVGPKSNDICLYKGREGEKHRKEGHVQMTVEIGRIQAKNTRSHQRLKELRKHSP